MGDICAECSDCITPEQRESAYEQVVPWRRKTGTISLPNSDGGLEEMQTYHTILLPTGQLIHEDCVPTKPRPTQYSEIGEKVETEVSGQTSILD